MQTAPRCEGLHGLWCAVLGDDCLQRLLEAVDVSLIATAVAMPNHPLGSSFQQCGGHGARQDQICPISVIQVQHAATHQTCQLRVELVGQLQCDELLDMSSETGDSGLGLHW